MQSRHRLSGVLSEPRLRHHAPSHICALSDANPHRQQHTNAGRSGRKDRGKMTREEAINEIKSRIEGRFQDEQCQDESQDPRPEYANMDYLIYCAQFRKEKPE